MNDRLACHDADTVLHVRQLDGAELASELAHRSALRREAAWDLWRTTSDLVFVHDGVHLCVPADFQTDLVSVPSIVGWFIPRAGRYARAAVLHDHLWSIGVDHGEADERFRVQLALDGVSLLRRWMMWAAVRMNSILTGRGGTGWLRDLPGAVLMLLLALPFVILPAATILVSNAAFFVVEWVVASVAPKEERPAPQWMT